MPKGSVICDFSKAKIYKLKSLKGDEIYIGSTCGELNTRLWHHNHSSNKKYTQKQCASKVLYEKYDDIKIELIENWPCENKDELNKRERYHIENTPNCINKNLPGQTWQERWEKNKEHNIIKHKEWLENNKNKIKEYLEETKEHRKETAKIYYDNNKDIINAKSNALKKVKVNCPDCNKEMNKNSLLEHRRKIHKNVI